MAELAVIVGSLALAAMVVFAARRNSFLACGCLFVYIWWHTPLLVAWIAPYRAIFAVDATDTWTLVALGGIHLALLSMVLSFRAFSTAHETSRTSPPIAPPRFFVATAYTAPLLLAIDFLLLRGSRFHPTWRATAILLVLHNRSSARSATSLRGSASPSSRTLSPSRIDRRLSRHSLRRTRSYLSFCCSRVTVSMSSWGLS